MFIGPSEITRPCLSVWIISISQIYPGGLGLLDTEDYRDANSTKCVAYRNLVTKLASLLGLEAEKATEFSDDVWEFETKLANVRNNHGGQRDIARL